MLQDSSYYSNNEISEEERRNHAFQVVNAIRESGTLAKNSSLPISYEYALDMLHTLNSKIYDDVISLLTNKNENDLVKYYKEAAEALSSDKEKIDPIELIEEELNKVQSLIDNKSGKAFYLEKKKFGLVAAKEYFKPRNQSEHKSLSHDFNLPIRNEYLGKPLYSDGNFKDFQISKNKILRLRLLHPDREEAILGVDLIYEHFDLGLNKVRFAHMQYKSWDNKTLYSSSPKNLLSQIKKMEGYLCSSGLCTGPTASKRDEYRFPYCSGFLRPTSKIQKSDSKLSTTGIHIPICQALKLFNEENKITADNSKDKSIKGHIFEELFISNIAGSRWIDIDTLEKFYKEKEITSNIARIRVHAQEIDIVSDYDKYKDVG